MKVETNLSVGGVPGPIKAWREAEVSFPECSRNETSYEV